MNFIAAAYSTSSSKSLWIFIIVLAAFAGLFIFFSIRRREIAFEGVVIDKDVVENQVQNNNFNRPGITFGNSGGVTHTYRIKVKTDAGKQINYQVTQGKYEIIKIGDRVSKPKGTTDVSVVTPAAQPAPATPAPPAANPPAPPTAMPPV